MLDEKNVEKIKIYDYTQELDHLASVFFVSKPYVVERALSENCEEGKEGADCSVRVSLMLGFRMCVRSKLRENTRMCECLCECVYICLFGVVARSLQMSRRGKLLNIYENG